MITLINVGSLILSTILAALFYSMSIQPAKMEQKKGPIAYQHCTINRWISGFFFTLAGINYIIYRFWPLTISAIPNLPWKYPVSIIIAILISIPSIYLYYMGISAAGKETMSPQKSTKMFTGIYNKIRHPQTLAELLIWFTFAFLLHSLHLIMYSIIWIPLYLIFCKIEEKDLMLKYGEQYEQYKNKTGMFFPKL